MVKAKNKGSKTKGAKETKSKKKPKTKHEQVLELCKQMNKQLKGDGKVVTGDQVDDLDFRKERTGLPAYDYLLKDGLIRGGAATLWGPDRCAKTTFAALIVRNFQRRGLACALAAIESFDKLWWRQLGVYIPYSEGELKVLDAIDRKKAKTYNHFYEKKGVVPLSLMIHSNGLRVLDQVVSCSRANVFDLIVVDSLGAVVGQDEAEGKSICDTKYGGNSKEMGIFANFITSTFNYKFNEDNTYNPCGDFHNDTIVLCINQARVEINTKARANHKLYHPPGGMGLRHLWNQAVFHFGSEEEGFSLSHDGRRVKEVHSRTFRLTGTKMRGGPEQRHADLDLSLKNWRDDNDIDRKGGEVDVWKSLRALSSMLGVFEQAGSNIKYKGEVWKGKAACEIAMRRDKALYADVYDAMLEASHKDYLTGSVPDIGW